ncbi:hypothetical protein COLO4_35213 [Corchorus olitorius]|uniref:Uncharacterized protein n=1 Tax=Corchorus olitorius TaxID=93759 RepID=A0A1R3GHT1_9ROSI|nr:hypothetical protein COLO4_35213 [Corchorus olitorius]
MPYGDDIFEEKGSKFGRDDLVSLASRWGLSYESLTS